MHLESQAELNDEKLRNLVDNMDYNLLTRVDEGPFNCGESAKKLRRLQYERRITLSQTVLRIIFSTLQNDYSGVTSKINSIFPLIWENSVNPPVEDPFGNSIQLPNLVVDHHESILWSQQLNSGIVDDNTFEKHNLDLLLRLSAFAITAVQLDQLNKATDQEAKTQQTESLRSTFGKLHQTLLHQFSVIKATLMSTESNNKYILSVGSGNLLLLPSWIRKISCFCRTLGTWGTVIITHLESSIMKESKKKKSKKGGSSGKGAHDSEERAIIHDIIHEYKQILQSLDQELNPHTESQLTHLPSVIEFIQHSCHSLLHGAGEKDILHPVTVHAIEGSIQVLAKQLLASQELVCSRLREVVKNRKHFIDSL